MFRLIEPEVAGGLGKETVLDNKTHPPVVEKLNYEFSGWMGDDILESFPCFIVTERLKNKILEQKLIGIIFEDVCITTSQDFKLLYPNIKLPKFYWAKVNGIFGLDDFAIAEDFRLVISEKAHYVLNLFNINQAIIEEVKKG